MRSSAMQGIEGPHGPSHRYMSPHLRHSSIVELLSSRLSSSIRDAFLAGLPPTLLEIGAGHGGYTERALAAGCSVTATEMSRASLVALDEKFTFNEEFRGVFDGDGSLAAIGSDRYSIILCSSVLHHIPDYIKFIEECVFEHLEVGGIFLSFQDPLWYPRVGRLEPLVRSIGVFVVASSTRRLSSWTRGPVSSGDSSNG